MGTTIKTAEQLIKIAKEKAMMHLESSQAELILGYLEGHDFSLKIAENGELMREDLADGEAEPCSMGDVIYSVISWNEELMGEAIREIQSPSSLENYWMALCDRDKYLTDGEILNQIVNAF